MSERKEFKRVPIDVDTELFTKEPIATVFLVVIYKLFSYAALYTHSAKVYKNITKAAAFPAVAQAKHSPLCHRNKWNGVEKIARCIRFDLFHAPKKNSFTRSHFFLLRLILAYLDLLFINKYKE